MHIQVGFLLERLAEKAEADASLRDRQPWKAAYERDYALARRRDHEALPGRRQRRQTAHRRRRPGVRGLDGRGVRGRGRRLPPRPPAPALGRRSATAATRRWSSCCATSRPTGSACYIVSGGGRDFMRAVTRRDLRHAARRVIGSSRPALPRRTATAARSSTSPSWTSSTTGRRSRSGSGAASAAARSSPSATRTATSRCSVRRRPGAARRCGCVVDHDDAEREFAYSAGAERALDLAGTHGWTVVSMRDDWATVFA